MRATLQTHNDGTVAIRVDQEAARVVFASILFASKFHEGIAPLVEVAKRGIANMTADAKGTHPCR